MVHYSCNEGYELFGSRRRICQFNEQWSQRLPECRRKLTGHSTHRATPSTPDNGDKLNLINLLRAFISHTEYTLRLSLDNVVEAHCHIAESTSRDYEQFTWHVD